jgi:hypothetical protein
MNVNDQTIHCPECGHEIPLTAALSEQIKHQLDSDFRAKLKENEAQYQARLSELDAEKKKLQEAQHLLDAKVEEKVKEREAAILENAISKAASDVELKVKDLETRNLELITKVTESQQKELELLQQKRELEEKQREVSLQIERGIQERQNSIYQEAKADAESQLQSKLLEKDKQLEMTTRALEAAKKQAEQGSMQIQGEAQEEDLKKIISASFPMDIVEDVPQGIKGGDLVQTVRSDFGQKCGVILWESKNTKTWSDDWVKKLKDDRGLVNADICVLVTRALPSDITHFGMKYGVWVTDYKFALALVSTLRVSLDEISQAKLSVEGRDQKIEQLFTYISGNQFKHRIENIVNAFESMQSDLHAEKRAMERIWNKREKEIDRVVTNTSGLYGDLQGITSAALPRIESLELPSGDAEVEEEVDLDQIPF